MVFNHLVRDLNDLEEVQKLIRKFNFVCLVAVGDDEISEMMESVWDDLRNDYGAVNFIVLNYRENEDLLRALGLATGAFSATVYFKGSPLTRVSRNVADVVNMLHDAVEGIPFNESDLDALDRRCLAVPCKGDITLLMKGNPDNPQCGFSRTMVQMLRDLNIEFASYDILKDEALRARNKVVNDWNTYPQIFAYGILLGGLDVIRDVLQAGGRDALMADIEIARKRSLL